MLGKLLKHEWKAVWKIPVLLIGILLAAAVMAGFTFHLPIWDSEWVGLPLSGVMMIITFYVAIIGVSLGITIYFAVRYYKNMFTDEGYLTNTLPVSSHQLLLSKVITMFSWDIISIIAIAASVAIFMGMIILAFMEPGDGKTIVDGFWELFDMSIWDSPYMQEFEGFCVSMIVMVLASAFSNTMTIVASVTIGQMVRRHRILGAFGAYFAIGTVMQIISTVILFPYMISTFDNIYIETPFPLMTAMYLIISAVSVIIGVGLYFLSEYLIRKQLELE
ncbi:MAG: hypothetical protein HFI99_00215 [Lachnospiraceae bacterium]|jgi:hypothetical protein|nr:hypothetical protein [Lachnospiraceae bacterium]MCI9324972.1 hypothetical protein [Lachnospiraceae bacterium]